MFTLRGEQATKKYGKWNRRIKNIQLERKQTIGKEIGESKTNNKNNKKHQSCRLKRCSAHSCEAVDSQGCLPDVFRSKPDKGHRTKLRPTQRPTHTHTHTTKDKTKTRQDKTRRDTTRHDTTQHGTTRHDTTRHDTTRHDTTRQDKTRQDKTRQDDQWQDKTKQDNQRQNIRQDTPA